MFFRKSWLKSLIGLFFVTLLVAVFCAGSVPSVKAQAFFGLTTNTNKTEVFFQTEICSGELQISSLDGVELQLCLPFTPDHSSVANETDWVQSGSWIQVMPHQEFSIYAIPYGVNPAADNLPMATEGITDLYKKATFNLYEDDLELMIEGPSISIFGENVNGTTYLLPDKNSDSPNAQKLVIEWIVEAGNRVWIIRSNLYGDFTDETIRQNILTPLENISIASTNLDAPSTSLFGHQNPPPPAESDNLQALGDLPFPSWWNGDCDTNYYLQVTGTSSSRLSVAPFRGLVACKPGGVGTGNYKNGVPRNFGEGVSQLEFQCAELPKRYLYLLYNIAPKSANGIDVVNVYDNSHPNLHKVANGTPNSGIAAGDIISYDGPTSAGHTAIITSVSVDGSGNGYYYTIEQNSSSTGQRYNTISNWRLNSNSGISVYLHDSGGGNSCDATSVPSGYVKCAEEGDNNHCNFSGTKTVYYGADSCYATENKTDGVECVSGNFGGDPLPGVHKACYIEGGSSGGEVKLYELANFGGAVRWSGGTGFSNDPNANTYSMEVPSGWSVKTWRGDNRTDLERCWSSSVNNFQDHSDWQNKVQSIEVFSSNVCPPNSPSLTSPSNGYYFNEGNSINLSWTATGSQYYGQVWGGPGGTVNFGWQSGTSKTIGSQWAGYTYSWHVKAKNNGGESSYSGTRTFTVRPGAPSNLSASAASCGQINLSWNDNSGNEEGYKIYRGGSLITTLGSGTTSYQNTGLSANTSYSYTVKAYRGTILSNVSNTASATTSSCGPTAPSLVSPSNGYYFNEGDSITLSWTDTGDSYYGEVWGGPAGTTPFGWQSGTSKTIGSQWAGYTYLWHVKAKNNSGESAYSSTRTFTVRPGAPSNLSASAASCSQINLSWNDNSGNEEGYKIYRGGSLITTLGSGTTSYQNTGLSANTSYSYTVKAYRGTILSNVSNTASATTSSCGPAVRAVGQWTADGSWNQKTTFTVGEPIVYILDVENITGADANVYLYYDVKDNFGNTVAHWESDWVTGSGTVTWGLSRTLPSEPGLHEFRGSVTYEGQTTELSMVYEVKLPDAPSNDDFNNAISISPTNSVSLDTRGATQNGDDPVIPNCNMNAGTATVWYKYKPTTNTAISLDTKSSDYDTFIAVWTGTRTNLSPVVCNDDIDHANAIYQSAVAFRAQANVTYYIEVGEWDDFYGASANALGAKEKNLVPTFPLWETEPEKLE